MKAFKQFGAEFIGTFWLVLGGCGAAVLSSHMGIGLLGIAFAFGLTVVVMAYAVGHISGGHFNPAVSCGMVIGGRLSPLRLPHYIIAQTLGATAAGWVILFIAKGTPGFVDQFAAATAAGRDMLACNGYGDHSAIKCAMLPAFIAEALLTGLFMFVILGTTDKRAPSGFAPLAIGLCLTGVHLVLIPVTNCSVNPARSTGVAFWQGGWALEQLWLFWAAPVAGAVVGALVYHLFGRSSRRYCCCCGCEWEQGDSPAGCCSGPCECACKEEAEPLDEEAENKEEPTA